MPQERRKSKEKPRHRFTDFSGGLFSAAEPHLIPENCYSTGQNIILENGVVKTRDGNAKIAALESTAEVTAACEYLYTDWFGALSRFLVYVESSNIRLAKWSGTAWVIVDTSAEGSAADNLIYTGLDTTYKASLTNYDNKLIITNAYNPPLELDRSYYDADGDCEVTTLGVLPPTRKLLISDFPATGAGDDDYYDKGITNQKYEYHEDSEGDPTSNAAGVIEWEDRINRFDVKGDNSCLKFTVTPAAASNFQSTILTFDANLDLTAFPDDATGASDVHDYISFSFYVESGMSYLDSMSIGFDFDDGDFTSDSQYTNFTIGKAQLIEQDWGGSYSGGRFNVKIPKAVFSTFKNTAVTDFEIPWNTVKAIRVGVTTNAAVKLEGEEEKTIVAYFDYLRMEETGPSPSSSTRLISDFENNGPQWVIKDTSTAIDKDDDVFQLGHVSGKVLKVKNGDNYEVAIDLPNLNGEDLSVWGDGQEKIRTSDFLCFEVYVKSGTRGLRAEACGDCVITVRFMDSAGKWFGVSKTTRNATYELTDAVRPYSSKLKHLGWHSVKLPMGWILGFHPLKNYLYSMYSSLTSSNPVYGNVDFLNVESNSEAFAVLEKVDKIRIAISFFDAEDKHTGANDYVLFDNLRYEKQPLMKQICSFSEHVLPLGQWVNGAYKVVKSWGDWEGTAQIVIDLAAVAIGTVFTALGATVHDDDEKGVELFLGETWTWWGTSDEDNPDNTKVSFNSDRSTRTGSQCMQITMNNDATFSLQKTFPSVLGSAGIDLSSYGMDATEFISFFRLGEPISTVTPVLPTDGGFTDGTLIDDSDEFSFWMFQDSKRDNQDFTDFTVTFTCDSSSEDYYVYSLTPSQLMSKNKNWVQIRWKKSQCIRHGTDTDNKGWWKITSVELSITNGSDKKRTLYLDDFQVNSAGAMTGDYRYKTVFRTQDTQSEPSGVSRTIPVYSSDIQLDSIPVSNDSRVRHKDIYRMGGTSSKWRYVDTIGASITQYIDTKSDHQLLEELDSDFEQPPIAKYTFNNNNSLFLFNTPLHPSRFLWSRPFKGASFPKSNYLDVEPGVGGAGTAIIVRDDAVIAFKENGIYRIVATKDSYYFDNISKKIGCNHPLAVTEFNNIIYFMWNKRPYRLVGNQIDETFDDRVEDLFKYADEQAVAVYNNDRILFAVQGTVSSTKNDVLIAYNLKYKAWEAVHSGSGWALNAMVDTYDGSLVGGASTALSAKYYVWNLFTGNTDNAGDITAKVITRYITGFEKRAFPYQFWAMSKKTGALDVLTLKPVIDYEEKTEDDFTLTNVTYPQISKINSKPEYQGAFIGLSMSCASSAGAWKLIMAVIEADAEVDEGTTV